MSKISPINPDVVPVPHEPNPRVVSLLEGMLERAKSGEIRAVAVAAVLENGHGIQDWAHTNDYLSMLGSVTILQERLAC